MKVYAIADLHFSFTEQVNLDKLAEVNVSKPMDKFGEKWEKHHVKLWRNWTNSVSEDDIVLIPGDISWALKLEEAKYDLEFLDMLPGNKIIGKGNHDYWWQSMKKISNITSDGVKILQNNYYELKGEYVLCGTRGWLCPNDSYFKAQDEKIYKRELIRLENSLREAPKGKKIVVMLHYPPVNDNHEKSGFIELMESYPVTKCIYGHLHGFSINGRLEGEYWGIQFQLVSADYLDFNPRIIID